MSLHPSILITGATAGIGRHLALHLAAKGFRVFATGRNTEALSSLEREADGHALETLRLDVTDAASIAAAKAEIDRRTDGHGVDVLVNNAGYGELAPVEVVSDRDLRAQFETNVFGLMAVTRAFLPAMRARGAGRIVNVSSLGGRVTFPFFGAYNATKYAVESLSDALRYEVAQFGVHVVLIEPGVIRSEFAERAMSAFAKYRTPDSPYAHAFDRAEEFKARSDAQAVGPEVIARVVERAIRSRRPAARYVAPFGTGLLVALLRLLPTRWVDAAFRRATGMHRPRLPSASSAPNRLAGATGASL